MKTFKTEFSGLVRLFLIVTLFATVSCSKSKSDEATAPTATTSTFTNAYNGVYAGNGTSGAGAPFSGSITVNVTSATTATLSGDAGNFTITGIAASSGSGYTGTTNGGGSISLSFSGTGNKDVNIGGPFTFNGSKP